MLNLIQDIELIQCQSINFIERIQARNVLSVSFNDINDVVFSSVAFDANICVVDLVLFQDGFDYLVADSVSIDHSRNGNTALIFFLKVDVRRRFVQPNSKALQFVFNNFFVLHRPG